MFFRRSAHVASNLTKPDMSAASREPTLYPPCLALHGSPQLQTSNLLQLDSREEGF
jgi:hypothetical protein